MNTKTVAHIEDPPGSKVALCTGESFKRPEGEAFELCPDCREKQVQNFIKNHDAIIAHRKEHVEER